MKFLAENCEAFRWDVSPLVIHQLLTDLWYVIPAHITARYLTFRLPNSKDRMCIGLIFRYLALSKNILCVCGTEARPILR